MRGKLARQLRKAIKDNVKKDVLEQTNTPFRGVKPTTINFVIGKHHAKDKDGNTIMIKASEQKLSDKVPPGLQGLVQDNKMVPKLEDTTVERNVFPCRLGKTREGKVIRVPHINENKNQYRQMKKALQQTLTRG